MIEVLALGVALLPLAATAVSAILFREVLEMRRWWGLLVGLVGAGFVATSVQQSRPEVVAGYLLVAAGITLSTKI